MAQQLEDSKRSLHEIRGAINNTTWLLTNYFPGDGPVQDVQRFPQAVTAADVAKSDGRIETPMVNRLAHLSLDVGGA